MKEAKFIPNWMVRDSSLENCSSYINFPALSDNRWHTSVWKGMNKVPTVVLTVRYSMAYEVSVCTCVRTWSFVCIQCPIRGKARRGWVMSYSLRETDGDTGVCISTVCVSVFVNPCAHDMPFSWVSVVWCMFITFFTSYCTVCDKSRVLQYEMIPNYLVLSFWLFNLV